MKAKPILMASMIFSLMIAATILLSGCQNTSDAPPQTSRSPQTSHQQQLETNPQPAATSTPRVPAHDEAGGDLDHLSPTLPPTQFFGRARLAYQAAQAIPKTMAQLPCYCYCDASFGHKSLHSCFVDNHASQCAICVDEALLAYRLQKEQGLTAAQIRDRIIAQHSTGE